MRKKVIKVMPVMIFTLFMEHIKAMRYEDAQHILDGYKLSEKQKGLQKAMTDEAKNKNPA